MNVPPEYARPDLTVVLMTYNERVTVAEVAGELCAALEALGRPWELLVVDDGSTDGSETIADRLVRDHPGVRVIHHAVNGGLGAVYRTGFAEARGRHVTFFPADGQFPADILATFRPAIEQADLVLGYLPIRPGAWVSQFLSTTERLIYRLLLGPMPRFQGIMMYRRELIEGMNLRSDGRGWAVVMEFVLRVSRGGRRVASLPTSVRPRKAGRSKVNNVRTILANLRQMLPLRRILTTDQVSPPD
ncbi:MAG: glycosyltransferase family 2 protein [Gemmatimonadales bacterium]